MPMRYASHHRGSAVPLDERAGRRRQSSRADVGGDRRAEPRRRKSEFFSDLPGEAADEEHRTETAMVVVSAPGRRAYRARRIPAGSDAVTGGNQKLSHRSQT